MTEPQEGVQAIAKAYVNAIANKDIDKIISMSAADVTCTSPLGQIQGIAAFRGFQEGFAKMIKKVTVIAVFGNDDHAVVVYDADTHPVANAVVAEHLVVKNGKIAATRVIYDATPFAAYVASLPARH